MSLKNKIVWSEGMFLGPHHFQQHDRYLEARVESRCAPIRPYSWGIINMEIDTKLLQLGKFSLISCTGIYPDGTPFNLPDDDASPTPLDIDISIRDRVIYLTLPLYRPGTPHTGPLEDRDGTTRYVREEKEVLDQNLGDNTLEEVEVGKLRLNFSVNADDLGGYTSIPIARIREVRTDNSVELDKNFIPPCMSCHDNLKLNGYMQEMKGLLHQRGQALAGRFLQSGQGGAAAIADFLLLQTVNRYQPVVSHYSTLPDLHPELLFRLMTEIAGDLSTFVSKTKRPEEFPIYKHDDLENSFAPMMDVLHQQLSMVLEQNAISLPMEERKFGVRVSKISNRQLLGSAQFVLAVSADIPVDDLRHRFPSQIKIGPVERISELVNNNLPGISITALSVAPRQIPYHAGYHYFQLDKTNDYWNQLSESGGFAFHVSGNFPSLAMEFWAIKG